MRADGFGSRSVGSSFAESSSVSPSGRFVAETYFSPGANAVVFHLARIGGATLQRLRLVSGPAAANTDYDEPLWAPDDTAVVLDRAHRTGVRSVSRPAGHSPWSPDGGLIAFMTGGSGRLHIGVRRPDGSGRRLLVRNLRSDCCAGGVPVWSPDGRALAFAFPFESAASRSDPPPQRWAVTVVRRDGLGLRRVAATSLTASADMTPAWSSDSRHLAFTDGRGIWVVPTAGGRPRRLARIGANSSVSWAPSSGIVFTHGGDIYTIVPGQRPAPVLR